MKFIEDTWNKVTYVFPKAVKLAWGTFLKELFPDWSWEKTLEEFPVIKFPTRIVFQEIQDDEGNIGFKVVEPWSYYLTAMYPKNTVQPVRRALLVCMAHLVDFIEKDDITFQDISIEIKFDPALREKEKSVVVVDSVEEPSIEE